MSDQTSLLQFGNGDTLILYDIESQGNRISSWNQYPNRYKFTGIIMVLNSDRRLVTRSTYALLTYLGDLGGLAGGLTSVCSFLLVSYNTLSYYNHLTMLLYV